MKSLAHKLRNFIDLLDSIGILINLELKTGASLSILKKISVWRHGFLSRSYKQYSENQKDINFSEYISDFDRRVKLTKINALHGILIANKLLMHDYLRDYKDKIPQIYFSINKGRIFNNAYQPVDKDSFLEFVKKETSLIFKPNLGYGGQGIMSYTYHEGAHVLNREKFTDKEFIRLVASKDGYMVSERIRQDDYAYEIWPHAVNTVRLVTMLDPETGEVRIAAAAQRFGMDVERPTDNWLGGGISTAIDLRNGVLGKSAINLGGKGVAWTDQHPVSKTLIKGKKIPNWHLACQEIKKMARLIHYCPFIGWDLAFSSSGFKIIEANNSPDVHVIQVHQPFFRSEDNKLTFGKYFRK